MIVFSSDSNDDRPNAWRDGIRDEEARVPEEYRHKVLVGSCQRNIECWLCSDSDWIAAETGKSAMEFRVADPKDIFEASLERILSGTRHETIVKLIQRAPLHRWLGNHSFEGFYERVRLKGKQLGCPVDNLRERRA